MNTCGRPGQAGCGAHLVWAKTVGGKAMPLDARQDGRGQWVPVEADDGNIEPTGGIAYGHGGELVPVVKVLGHPQPGAWRNHWATCPNREQFRRTKARRARQ